MNSRGKVMSLPDTTVQSPLGYTRFWTTKMLEESEEQGGEIEERETGVESIPPTSRRSSLDHVDPNMRSLCCVHRVCIPLVYRR